MKIESKKITINYPNKNEAIDQKFAKILDQVSLDIDAKSLVAILGPSGSGKTSYLSTFRGYVPKNSITSGEILVDGHIRSFTEFFERTSINEQEELVYEEKTMYQNVYEAAYLSGNLEGFEKKFDYYLDELEVKKRKFTLVSALSGGERKRFMVIKTLIENRDYILLDEPTSGLDDMRSYRMVELLKKEVEKGKTIVFTVHQPDPAILELVDKLILIHKGSVLYQGSVDDAEKFFNKYGIQNTKNRTLSFFLLETIDSRNAMTKEILDKMIEDLKKENDKNNPKIYLKTSLNQEPSQSTTLKDIIKLTKMLILNFIKTHYLTMIFVFLGVLLFLGLMFYLHNIPLKIIKGMEDHSISNLEKNLLNYHKFIYDIYKGIIQEKFSIIPKDDLINIDKVVMLVEHYSNIRQSATLFFVAISINCFPLLAFFTKNKKYFNQEIQKGYYSKFTLMISLILLFFTYTFLTGNLVVLIMLLIFRSFNYIFFIATLLYYLIIFSQIFLIISYFKSQIVISIFIYSITTSGGLFFLGFFKNIIATTKMLDVNVSSCCLIIDYILPITEFLNTIFIYDKFVALSYRSKLISMFKDCFKKEISDDVIKKVFHTCNMPPRIDIKNINHYIPEVINSFFVLVIIPLLIFFVYKREYFNNLRLRLSQN